MIPIIFIAMVVSWLIWQTMDKKRRDRNEEMHERKREAYTNLLEILKEKKESTDKTEENDKA